MGPTISRKSAERRAPRAISRPLLLVAALALVVGAKAPARAESAYCGDLRVQIANAGAGSNSGRYRAAAVKQQGEFNRLAGYARSIGCDRQQFLFFGDSPPAQCGQLNARLANMRAQIAALERAGGDDGRRQALIARYDAECRDRHIVSARPRNFFEELFGVAPPDETGGLREVPVEPVEPALRGDEDLDGAGDRPRGGSMAICVRACDGGFFPVSYSARSSNLDELSSLCKALCPNAEVTLYTRSPWRELDTAVSIDGAAYSDHPNALKFQKSYDPSCGCKPSGRTWAEALADAERILAASHTSDTVVTAEQAEQLSRPVAASEARGKSRQKNSSTRRDAAAPAPAPAPTEPGAPANGDDDMARASDVYRDVVGPDGIKRRVRVVAPTL